MRRLLFRFAATLLLTMTVITQTVGGTAAGGTATGESETGPVSESNSTSQESGNGVELTSLFVAGCHELDDELRQAMLTVLRQHPETTRWSGLSVGRIFSLVAIEIPDGKPQSRIRQAIRSECGIRVIAELLTAKSLLSFYQAERLDDVTTLKAAALTVGPILQRSGKLTLDFKRIVVEGKLVVGLAVADRVNITAVLSEPSQKELVKDAYRTVMHRQARLMMEKGHWNDALGFWRHLHDRRLVSARLYLDAAFCFGQIGKQADAAAVAREALETYTDLNDSGFYEELGEILLLDSENIASRKAAEVAFRYADERFTGNQTVKAQ